MAHDQGIISAKDCLKKMTELVEAFETEGFNLNQLKVAWKIKYEQALMQLNQGNVDYFENASAKATIMAVINEGRLGKLTISDKEAIIHAEYEDLYGEYSATRLEVELTEKAFNMYNSIMISKVGQEKLRANADSRNLHT